MRIRVSDSVCLPADQSSANNTSRPILPYHSHLQGKIAFEEHFALEETLGEAHSFAGDSGRWDDFTREILDLGAERLSYMDDSGIEIAVLSLNAPGEIQLSGATGNVSFRAPKTRVDDLI